MEHNGKRKQPGGQVTWGQSRSPGSSCFQLVIPELREYFPNIPNVPSPYVCGLSTMLMAWPGAVLRPYFPLLGSFHASEITLLSLDICVPLPPAPFHTSLHSIRVQPFLHPTPEHSQLPLSLRMFLIPLLSLTVLSKQTCLSPQTLECSSNFTTHCSFVSLLSILRSWRGEAWHPDSPEFFETGHGLWNYEFVSVWCRFSKAHTQSVEPSHIA